MLRQVLLWGATGGILTALLKLVEYKHFVHEYPTEIYGGIVALIFTGVGIWVGLRLTRPKAAPVPVAFDEARIRESGLTPREHEVLTLIAEGLSNREIGERLFVSENTVKTHSARLFDKLQVNRRLQAVRRAKDLGLIP